MAITYGFYNAIKQSDGIYDRVYNSEQISNMFEGLVTSGVYESVGDALIVKEKSGLTVEVGTGRIVMSDGKWMRNDAKLDITLAAAHLTLDRWSAIVVRADRTNRTITIVEKAGTPATNPTKPAITVSQTIEEKCLAYVYVGKGVTAITQANITDVRADASLCGWVTGIVKQLSKLHLIRGFQRSQISFRSIHISRNTIKLSTWDQAMECSRSIWLDIHMRRATSYLSMLTV